MSDTSQSVAETVTTHDDIVVRRELSRKGGGIVGTLRIQSTSETPATVHVVDEFPATLPIDVVGFEPGAEPESGVITPQRATVTQPVADDPVEIEYELKLSEEVSDRELNAPPVRVVVTTEDEGAPLPYTDGGERSSASVESTSETVDSDAPSPQEPAGTETEPTGVGASSDASERAVEQVDGGPEETREPTDAATSSADPDDVDGTIDLDTLQERADSLEEQVETTEDSLTADVDDLRTHVYDEIARLDTDLANQSATFDGVRTDVDTLDDRVTGVEAEIQGVRGIVLGVQAEFATLSDDVEAMRDELEKLRTEVGELAESHE